MAELNHDVTVTCWDHLLESGPVPGHPGQFVSLQPGEFIVGSRHGSDPLLTRALTPCRHLLVIIGPGSDGLTASKYYPSLPVQERSRVQS